MSQIKKIADDHRPLKGELDAALVDAVQSSYAVLKVMHGVQMALPGGVSCTSKMSLEKFVQKIRTHLLTSGVTPDAATAAMLEFSRKFLKRYMGARDAGKVSKYFN